MKNIASRLRELSRTKGTQTFCSFIASGKTESVTFAQLFERSAAYAALIRAQGVRPGDVVLVILEHTPQLFYAFLGAVLAGAVPSFMPFPTSKQRPDLYWGDHRTLFERIMPALVVTYEQNARAAREILPDLTVPFLVVSGAAPSGPATESDLTGLNAAPDSVAVLQHSSGTTGLKKGVMLTHRAIGEQIEAYAREIALRDEDVIASWLPLYHDMGFVACFLTAVLRGIRLVALNPFEWAARPRILLDAIQRHRATLCWLPNFAFAHLVNTVRAGEAWDLSSIRAFVNCSEPCKPRAFERFVERFSSSGIGASQLHVCYALAENVFAATQTRLGDAVRTVRGVLSCGRPVHGVTVEVRGTDGSRLADGEVGEIAIASPFLFDGYHRLPELTAERLRDGWYATGDLGFADGGELFVTGRKDDLLAVNGRNYYAHELEAIASEVPGCVPGRVVALCGDDRRNGTQELILLAEVEDEDDAAGVCAELKAAILERTGVAVHRIRALGRGRLIKTTSGKISRVENKRLYLEEAKDVSA